ncbi:MAG TPA: FAD-dependent oxidoreductase, partial [Paludibacter sp.]|nr:FAD-dependent oxidoreductase [Paludibacter sp.]
MEYDIVIIGAGPAGYAAAIRAGQLGLKTAIIEKMYMGGMCLNWGCIPTKSLLECAKIFDKVKHADDFGIDGIFEHKISFNWEKAKKRSQGISGKLTAGISYLIKKNGVDIIYGTAKIGNDHTILVDDKKIQSKNIIIATGSKPKISDNKIANAPIVEVEKLFSLETIPENIIVTGNHISAIELAQFFKLIGKKVTLVANSDYFLDGLDDFLISHIHKIIETNDIKLILNAYPEKFKDGFLIVDNQKIKCDILVNCNSRKAIIPESESPIELTERGFIKTTDFFETNLKGVYAIGDVSGKSFLAHLASAQAIHVVNFIKGIVTSFDSTTYPINMYTIPEISQIGMTEKRIKEVGIDYKVSEFPL